MRISIPVEKPTTTRDKDKKKNTQTNMNVQNNIKPNSIALPTNKTVKMYYC